MKPGRVFSLRGLSKVWAAPDAQFRLEVPYLDISAGDQIAVLGKSGCGKSTLLDILATTLEPTVWERFRFQADAGTKSRAGFETGVGANGGGRVDSWIDIGKAWRQNRLDLLAGLRRRHIGYVLQTGGLLPFLSVRENIELPRRLCGLGPDQATRALVGRLGIDNQLDKLPQDLSVGQRQRVAVARALVHEPRVILADEPTASLDPHTAAEVMELLVELAQRRGITLIVATHDWEGADALGLTKLHHQQRTEDRTLYSEFHS